MKNKHLYFCGIIVGGLTMIGSVWIGCWTLHLVEMWAYIPVLLTFGPIGVGGFGLLAINLDCFKDAIESERNKRP